MKLILTTPSASYAQAVTWARSKKADPLFIEILPHLWEAGVIIGVDPILVIAQCAKETGYCKFGGVLDASYCNTCGLKNIKGGSDTDPEAHARFDSWEEGALAHAQHLALYAGKTGYPLKEPLDPRHFSYLLGLCKYVEELSNNWAGASYGEEISSMMDDIVSHEEKYNSVLEDEIKELKGKLQKIKEIIG